MKPSILCMILVLPVTAQTPPPAPPKTAAAVAGPWVKTVTLPAEALPYYRIHLGTSTTGWVGSISADVGSRVKAGDLLAEIRAPELVAARDARAEEARAAKQLISQAASKLKSAEAEATAAKSEFTRITHLAVSGSVTTKARDEAEARSAAAEAKVGEAQAGMVAAEAEALAAAARATEAEAALEYTRITAPFDGLVVARNAELGDFLGAASKRESLFTLEQNNPLRVRIHIPEHAAALADVGDAATLDLGGLKIPAKLNRISSSLDPVTKTMTAEIDLTETSLLPGTMGSATLNLASLESAVTVPYAALHTAADGSRFVKVLDGSETREVPVTLAAMDGRNAILSTGPANGAKVILP